MRTVLGKSVLVAAMVAALAACGDDDAATASDTTAAPEPTSDATVVVTTNILGDVVRTMVGDGATVEVVMPPNADPHDFAPSAQQAASMRSADALVVNGLGFEEGLVGTIEAVEADGVVVIAATDAIEPLEFTGAHDAGHDDEGDDAGHDDEGDDPHLFTDPARMAEAVAHIADELAEHVDGLDTPDFRHRVAGYIGELEALDAEVEEILEAVPADRRVLVTNHDVFGYFADRYGFEVLGIIIPGGSTLAEPSPRDLAALAAEIEEEAVPAIFAEVSAPARLADALAGEGQEVEVVELFTESLGEAGSGGETYLEMVRTNAQRIADALSR
jgi:zinc/manganese transport system substrate-binding protein